MKVITALLTITLLISAAPTVEPKAKNTMLSNRQAEGCLYDCRCKTEGLVQSIDPDTMPCCPSAGGIVGTANAVRPSSQPFR
jgi:hypothetical protein